MIEGVHLSSINMHYTHNETSRVQFLHIVRTCTYTYLSSVDMHYVYIHVW